MIRNNKRNRHIALVLLMFIVLVVILVLGEKQLSNHSSDFKDVETQAVVANDHTKDKSSDRKEEDDLIITWIDDDGHVGFYTKLYPLAQEYNIPFTSALITNRPGTSERWLSWEHIHEMRDSGLIEFISHSNSHDQKHSLIDMTREELYEDLTTSKDILKEHDLNHRALVYPFDWYDDATIEVTSEVFDYALGSKTTSALKRPVNKFDIKRVDVQVGFDNVKNVIDDAKQKSADENVSNWVVLRGHVDQKEWWSEDYARQIIEYALDEGFEFVTTKEGVVDSGVLVE